MIIRAIIIILLVFLMLNPELELKRENIKEFKWNIYVDRSLSMSYHSNISPVSFISGVDEFSEKLSQKNIDYEIIGFDSDIDSMWSNGNKNLDGIATNIGTVIDHLNLNNLDKISGAVIFTDGQVNMGRGVLDRNNQIDIPIHVVGIGDVSPMVDVEVSSIDAPPLLIKGEEADLHVKISSYGIVNERGNVTLYHDNKLIGSKVINISGSGSQEEVRFRIKPSKTGKENYEVKVNTITDEVNIKNNKQTVQIQVLKDEYKIAMLTGSPNFNSGIIKRFLSNRSEFSLDHFVYKKNSFHPSLSGFWEKKYDLILFDNHPIDENAKNWKNYLKVFAKKLISHQSNFAMIIGPNVKKDYIEDYFSLTDSKILRSFDQRQNLMEWELADNWFNLFPFSNLEKSEQFDIDYPPLTPGFKMKVNRNNILGRFNGLGDSEILFLCGQKNSLRFFIWNSLDIHNLYYKSQNTSFSDLLTDIFDPIFNWLLNAGGGQEIFFRTDKNSYYQGERITITGKPINPKKYIDGGVLTLYLEDQIISKKQLNYDPIKDEFRSQFWASQSGNLDFDIKFDQSGSSHIMGRGSFQVQDSQIELNKVYLDEKSLRRFSDFHNGVYKNWSNKNDLLSNIEPHFEKEFLASLFNLNSNVFYLSCILILLTIEWIFRRRIGLI